MHDSQYAATLPFVAWKNAFSDSELKTIVEYGERVGLHRSVTDVPEGEDADAFRVSRTAWMPPAPEIEWMYERMAQMAAAVNQQVYQFDIQGFSEPFQYTVYRHDERAHFDWHVDQGRLKTQRKLSFTLQLSDPAEYEGGDLEFSVRRVVDAAPKERGVVVAFPAWVLHRVTPVTSGVRRSVVAWTTGPRFR